MSTVTTASRGPFSARWQEVLDVSAEVFFRRGYAEASVGDVAAALHMTKGSLYHYVRTKEDLLYEIIRQAHDLTLENLQRARAVKGSALDRLHGYFVGHIRINTDHLAKSTLIYRDLHNLSDDRRQQIISVRDDIETYVRGLLGDGARDGTVCPLVDSHLTSIEMFSTANGVYQWYRPNGPHAADEVAHSVADFVVSAVACGSAPTGLCFRHAHRP
ncbi:TetR/AcrR family transcriptional regulator [Streptomyces sp. NPDC048002]|uniref:TetR/AcrR family transcriptional regulator n=1 Tax=Streptomyces sp. NPDC048002 TaxID=3154344 RepID=UPI0033DCC98A